MNLNKMFKIYNELNRICTFARGNMPDHYWPQYTILYPGNVRNEMITNMLAESLAFIE